MTNSLLKISDLSKKDVQKIIKDAFDFKNKLNHGQMTEPIFKGKVVAMIFEKPSLRTKVAFEVASQYFGAYPTFLTSQQILASAQNEPGRESIPDIAKNLERFADLIIVRTYKHDTVKTIAHFIKKPVINALCDQHHPTQALADLMAVMWHKKNYKNIKVAFVGDGNNVATSLMQICAIMGLHFSIASPSGYEIPPHEKKIAQELAKPNKSTLEFIENPQTAVKNADIIYTDTFVSMGQEAEKTVRLKKFKNYQVTMSLLKKAKKNTLFMHCLPAHRSEEVTDKVMDCPQSIIFDQAECRLHIAKALLKFYLS